MRQSKSTFTLLLSAVVFAACGLLRGPQPDRTRLYVLTPTEASATAAADSDLSVGLQLLRLPSYLDGYDIVTRVGENELRRNPLERWAEPLDSSFRRALGQNLSGLLNTQRVLTSSWYGKQQPLLTLSVLVERFEPTAGGTATLIARWSLRRGADQSVIAVRESRHDCSIAGSSTTAAVDALSRCLGDLSRDIAAVIEAVR
jgi:uncharacterized lipoprotein YmbA